MVNNSKKYIVIAAIIVALLLLNPSGSSAAALIKQFEVGKNNDPYLEAIPDTNNRWQIGYGSTWNYANDRWVKKGDRITKQQAEQWLQFEIDEKNQLISEVVKKPINNNQRLALVSFSYNVGSTAFKGSTLLELLNEGKPKQVVADQFLNWVYAEGRKLPGLVNRRNAERLLFLS